MKKEVKKRSKKVDPVIPVIDKDYLISLKNLGKGKEQHGEAEFKIFLKNYLKLAPEYEDKTMSKKQIQEAISTELKKAGFKTLSRPRFFRLQQRVLNPLGETASKQLERLTAELHAAKERKRNFKPKSPTSEPINLLELKEDIEAHFKKIGDKIRSGNKKGSKLGGEATKKKYI